MKVLYDYQVFQWLPYGGIARIFYEEMNYFHRTGKVDFELALKYSPNFYLKNSNFAADKALDPATITINSFLPGVNFRGKGRLFGLYSKLLNKKAIDTLAVNKQTSIDALEAGNFDVFHPTNYDPYFLDHIGNKPFVLSFYDLIHEIFPEMLMWDKSYVPRRELAQKAAKIIAISETTKRDLITIYDIDPAKIEVVYLAGSLNMEQEDDKLKLPAKYLVYVGNREFYKNFYFFARVFAKLTEKDPELHLVCAGGGKFKPAELEYFEILGIKDKVMFAGSEDASIAKAYKHALALVTPSWYEGFNIPIVEAFNAGCPVIAANTGPSPEVGSDAALYFSPKDFESMYTQIDKVIYNDQLRAEMIARGTARAADFSWQKNAEQTMKVYESVV